MKDTGNSNIEDFTDSEEGMFKEALGDEMYVYRDCLEAIPVDQEEPTFQIAVAKRGNEYCAFLYELDESGNAISQMQSDYSPNPFVTVDAIEEFKSYFGY